MTPPGVDGPRLRPFATGFFLTLGALVAIGLALALVQVQFVLLVAVVALFIALGLNPMVEWLQRRRFPRPLAVLAVVALGLGLLALAVWAIVPVISQQITAFLTNAPGLLERLQENRFVRDLDARWNVVAQVQAFFTSGQVLNQAFGGVLGAGVLVANTVAAVVLTTVLAIYFLGALPSIKEVFYRLSPATRRPRTRYLADQMFRRVGNYLTGMFVVATLAGLCSFVFLTIAGLGEYALALAVLVSLFAFVPLIGLFTAMGVIALVALATSPWLALAVIIYFLIYAQFDAYVVQPRVMGRSVEVPGPVVIIAATTGGLLLGIIGAVLAIPTAAVVLLLYREVLLPELDRR